MRARTTALTAATGLALLLAGAAVAQGQTGRPADAPPAQPDRADDSPSAGASDTAPSGSADTGSPEAPSASAPPPSEPSMAPSATASRPTLPSPGKPPRPHAAKDEDDEALPEVAPARDTVGRHLAVGLNAGLIAPFGSLQRGAPQSDTMGPGLTAGGDITYGISRTVMLGVYADVGLPEGMRSWSGDSVSTIAVGPMLRYHLVQGVRFDPWLGAGLGFRRTSGRGTSVTGVDWVRLSIGIRALHGSIPRDVLRREPWSARQQGAQRALRHRRPHRLRQPGKVELPGSATLTRWRWRRPAPYGEPCSAR